MSKVRWVLVVAVVILVALTYVCNRMASTHKRVQAVALINALQQLYDVTVGTNQADYVGHDLDPHFVRKLILDKLGHDARLLPSFVDAHDIYVTQKAVPFQSTNLFLSIKVGDKLIYAISADRQSKELSIPQFNSWQHERL